MAFDAFGGNGLDCNDHGTNVAGIIGGTTYGIAKEVTLHAVRVYFDCTQSTTNAAYIAGVDWVTANRALPAVANLSQRGVGSLPTLDTAVTNSIASGVTYVVAAGSNIDACMVSPASCRRPSPSARSTASNDTRCFLLEPRLELRHVPRPFRPRRQHHFSWDGERYGKSGFWGTSQAAPHVAGVAARFCRIAPAATPADVWAAIHNADDIFSTTTGWPGIINLGAGSPNELLHWGSLNDGFNDGDPHITTVDGVHYDFQSAGEFVSLRDGDGLEIQTRQTPIATTFNPGPNPYTGLATCVSLNTAVAARVGTHRVTFEPNLSGVPDPSGLQLRVDGNLTTLSASGLNFGDGGRVASTVGGGIEIDFPDGTVLIVTPGWWASQGKWYLNVDVFRTTASAGLMGAIPPGSWLPALPDGTSMGPMPGPLHERYVDLYQKFGEAWRVTDKTSLFDYAPGTSTETFTMQKLPQESPPCVLADQTPVKPLDPSIAQEVCRPIVDKNRNADCVFDVTVTGERGFAQTYLLSQRIELGSTTTTMHDDKDPTKPREPVTFTATVGHMLSSGGGVPIGTVQFTLDGSKVGETVKLDSNGRAMWKVLKLSEGIRHVTASYIPSENSMFLASSSLDEAHTVSGTGHWPGGIVWVAALFVLIILLLVFVWWPRSK